MKVWMVGDISTVNIFGNFSVSQASFNYHNYIVTFSDAYIIDDERGVDIYVNSIYDTYIFSAIVNDTEYALIRKYFDKPAGLLNDDLFILQSAIVNALDDYFKEYGETQFYVLYPQEKIDD